MQAWVNKKLAALVKSPDAIAMSVGLVGLFLLLIGIGLVYVPAAFIVGGIVLMCWSYMAARAIAARAPGGLR
jgi:hypothetical protein